MHAHVVGPSSCQIGWLGHKKKEALRLASRWLGIHDGKVADMKATWSWTPRRRFPEEACGGSRHAAQAHLPGSFLTVFAPTSSNSARGASGQAQHAPRRHRFHCAQDGGAVACECREAAGDSSEQPGVRTGGVSPASGTASDGSRGASGAHLVGEEASAGGRMMLHATRTRHGSI